MNTLRLGALLCALSLFAAPALANDPLMVRGPVTLDTGAVSIGNVHVRQSSASVPISTAAASTTQLVAVGNGKPIYVGHFDMIAAGTTTTTLVYGTGTNCGTGTTALTGAYPLTAQVGISAGVGFGPVLIVPAGNALCITNSATIQVSGALAYAQF